MQRVLIMTVIAAGCAAPPTAGPPTDPQAHQPSRGATPSVPTPLVGGTWTKLTTPAPAAASMAFLLTDGTVMVQGLSSSAWFRLTPDASGSYVNGTWSSLATTPNSYAPLYYASGFFLDGRLVIHGGEYDGGSQAETSKGAVYDPVADKWTMLAPPPGWSNVGDAPSVVLADGRLMIGKYDNTQQAILDPTTLTYSATGTGKADANSEESWALLWDNTVLTIDIFAGAQSTNSEIYNPASGSWSTAGSTQVVLHDAGLEIGPMVVRPDGTVFAAGATGHTSVYNQMTKAWTAGPDFPTGLDVADGPAALLANGNVLVPASPGDYQQPLHFFEFDGTSLTEVAGLPGDASLTSYEISLLPLPNGQVLATSFTTDVEVYTPQAGIADGTQPIIESLPTLFGATSTRTAAPPNRLPGADDGSTLAPAALPLATLHHGRTYEVWARRMNGISEGSYYGDDAHGATNYPIARITNAATNHVFYARTHHASTRAIGPSVEGSTLFDVPATVELGASTLEIIANGVASPAVAVEVD
jgi:hypothetical protein